MIPKRVWPFFFALICSLIPPMDTPLDDPPSYYDSIANDNTNRSPSEAMGQSSIKDTIGAFLRKFGYGGKRQDSGNRKQLAISQSGLFAASSNRSLGPEQVWKPMTLNAPILTTVILISGGLIAVVQILLANSQHNDGIIFAADIDDLPLNKSFSYLYLPTIIAVIYSFLWTWIDLDAKRLEPYYQLSKEGGASGKDSLLLQYPFEFVASVPLKAIRSK